MGELAGRCISSTHFEYPKHNCSMGMNEISTHLCFSGFTLRVHKADYIGGVPAADVCSVTHPLGCSKGETDAYLECFRRISRNDFTHGIYEGVVRDYRRIHGCNDGVHIRVSRGLLLFISLLWLCFHD